MSARLFKRASRGAERELEVVVERAISEALSCRPGAPAELILRGVTVLDPAAGIEGPHDVVIRAGRIAELTDPGSAKDGAAEVIEADGLHAFPAFFDPHVHLRTPGREDEEDIETGTRAAAAGGFCGILALANTEPPVSTAADVEALRERAGREASIPVGFFATVSRDMRGEELTEMAELSDAGAVGFSDDGLPVRSARLLRMALQYQRLCGGVVALHEEDPDLSGDGVMHEGQVSAALGMAGIPSVSESTAIARDAALAGYEEARIHVQHLSAWESVEAVRAAKAAGVKVSCEATPHHLTLTDEAVRGLDARFKMNPPLRSDADRAALVEGLRDGTIDCIATDHAPHSTDEKEVPFEAGGDGGYRARDRLRRPAHRPRPRRRDRPRAAGIEAGRRGRALRAHEAQPGARQRGKRGPLRSRCRVDGRRGRL